ncbi:GST N-terminal domain-containing protein [Plasmodiophora brassicae]|uniref:glutathione transferase n=1 Tax=Plasmodiophora brassicae TaxID=37360 RepID=A0A0G4IMQ8_PLABS|nr:hypothetical protein PBRA_005058 [Plasmodiophora brassicae]SPQ99329.1 unnamed protein product [Plasmodiophora brassicae]
MSTSFQVYYFPIQGRAEPIRLLLALAGADWDNKFPTDWPSEKAGTPMGQLPVLIEKSADGSDTVIPQSHTIMRYVARKFGFDGSNDRERTSLDAIYESFVDLIAHVNKHIVEPVRSKAPKDQADQLRATFFSDVLPRFVALQEKHLSRNGNNGHFVGGRVSYVDVIAYFYYARINFEQADALNERNAPAWTKLYRAIDQNGRVQAYLKSPKRPGVYPPGMGR